MPRCNDIAKILIIGLGFVSHVWQVQACSFEISTVRVPANFRVIVLHGSTPIAGIPVEVYKEDALAGSQAVVKVVTSGDGAAEVKNLFPGKYVVATSGPGGGSAVIAEVGKHGKRRNHISLEWPGKTVNTKSLSGELASNNPWTPFERIHLELWAAGASAPLEMTDTDGRFHFNQAKPGVYILRVQGRQKLVGNQQVKGDIPIELAPDAREAPAALALHLAMTSCGITYDDCPIPNIVSLRSRRMKLLDPLGAAISGAKYRLLDPAGNTLAEGETNAAGMTQLPSSLLGKATLQVASPGFTLLTQPLDLLAHDARANDILVVMAVHGSETQCSAVGFEKNLRSQ